MAMTNFPIPSPRSPIRCLPFSIGRFLFLICHLSSVILLPACARPDDTWDRVRETGVLRVGMDASFPPFETIAPDGTLVGFDVDLARELARRLGPALPAPSAAEESEAEGIEVHFVANLPYDGLYDALAVDRVDLVISALVVNPARMADFAYSTPYFDAGQVLVVRVQGTGVAAQGPEADGSSVVEGTCPELIEGMGDLGGCTLAVEFGAQGDLEARKWARRRPGLTVVPYQTAAEALAAVAAGKADVALVDHVSALVATPKTLGVFRNPKGFELVIVKDSVVEEPYAVAVHRGSQHLLRAINKALADMKADGTLEALTARWLEQGH